MACPRRSWKDLIAATAEASEVQLGPGDSAMEDTLLVMIHIAIENGHEIVDSPIEHGGSFHSYVSYYQRVWKQPLSEHVARLLAAFGSSVLKG